MSTSAKLQQVVEIALADQFWTYADTQSLAKERSDAARAALRDLAAQADPPLPELRRLLDAYYGDEPESMEVAVAAQKIEAWLARLDGAR